MTPTIRNLPHRDEGRLVSEELRILIVDDDEADQVLAQAALRAAGIDVPVEFASDGIEGLEKLRSGHPLPSLVIMDLNMPRMDGRAFLQEIKSDPELRSIPAIVLTTSSSEHDIRSCYAHLANSYLVKPVGMPAFIEMISQALDYWLRINVMPSPIKSSADKAP